ncbi:MAG: DHH family phosphoesterase [Candidatus Magasanikbacteria bacterium]|nr:DHH family phosphoesterase [Candidatus Magasanikbacteria bacterium]
MIDENAQSIAQHLKQARFVLLIPGTNPDGDSVSSVCALRLYCEAAHIPAALFCPTPISQNLAFLPGVHEIQNDNTLLTNPAVDTIIVCDAGDLRYAGLADTLATMTKRPTIINIDHHASNEHFGDFNLVNPSAAATTEVIYGFFKAVNFPLTEDSATCLLTGLMTDTEHFSNAATTASAMDMASDLITRGARLHTIREHTQNNKPVALLKLWGIALARLYYQPRHDSVVTYLFQKDYEHYGLAENEVNGISNFLNNLGEGKYTLFLKETTDGQIKGSLRTTRDDVDVAELAKQFGGGGHKKAAGFMIPGRLEETARGVRMAP